jgi:hypothetical protein
MQDKCVTDTSQTEIYPSVNTIRRFRVRIRSRALPCLALIPAKARQVCASCDLWVICLQSDYELAGPEKLLSGPHLQIL